MKIYTHEEMLDRVLGSKGTKARDEHEDSINAFLMGETIKKCKPQRERFRPGNTLAK